MVNNDILKKLRIALKLKDTDILEILKLSGMELSATDSALSSGHPTTGTIRNAATRCSGVF